MKVLHAAFMAQSEPGILRQMSWENQAGSSLGISWDARLYTPAASAKSDSCIIPAVGVESADPCSVPKRAKRWFALRRNYYTWLSQACSDYDAVLLRHTTCDPFRASFIKEAKIPVFSVHHSLEVPELKSRPGLEGRVRSALESRLGAASIGASAGIVAVTEEIRTYELSRVGTQPWSYVYPNGIAWSDGLVSASEVPSTGVPEILFVASTFVPWHGLDLLLDDIETSNEKFVLHLVGRLFASDEVRARNDPRIVVHGLLKQDELKQLYRKCSLGLTSFALERKGMQEACTLKVREYLSVGLPVYSGHSDVFPQDFRFYRTGKASIQTILEFERSVRGESRAVISEESRPYIEKKRLLANLYKALEASF